jgi:hypothetical protein
MDGYSLIILKTARSWTFLSYKEQVQSLSLTLPNPLLRGATVYTQVIESPLFLKLPHPNPPRCFGEGTRLLTLCVFEGFFGKLFVLFFVCGKTPVAGVFPQEHTTHFLHEALWGKGFKVNSLGGN